MQLLKPIFILFVLVLGMQSCEVDDICVEDVITPKLIIEFYDVTNILENKEVDTLSIWIEGKDKLYDAVQTDSIAIPLDLNANNTKYLLSKSDTIDYFHIYHTNKEIFVSRSCGFKMNFTLQNETQLTNEWTDGFETNESPQTIENEQTVHIKIYH